MFVVVQSAAAFSPTPSSCVFSTGCLHLAGCPCHVRSSEDGARPTKQEADFTHQIASFEKMQAEANVLRDRAAQSARAARLAQIKFAITSPAARRREIVGLSLFCAATISVWHKASPTKPLTTVRIAREEKTELVNNVVSFDTTATARVASRDWSVHDAAIGCLAVLAAGEAIALAGAKNELDTIRAAQATLLETVKRLRSEAAAEAELSRQAIAESRAEIERLTTEVRRNIADDAAAELAAELTAELTAGLAEARKREAELVTGLANAHETARAELAAQRAAARAELEAEREMARAKLAAVREQTRISPATVVQSDKASLKLVAELDATHMPDSKLKEASMDGTLCEAFTRRRHADAQDPVLTRNYYVLRGKTDEVQQRQHGAARDWYKFVPAKERRAR